MRIIAVSNQKGGCGKTTTAINLSASLASKGKKVLLIDFDPQSHATMGLNIDPSDIEENIYHVLTSEEAEGRLNIEDITVPIKDNFDLAPSSVILSAFEQKFAGKEERENKLRQAIQALKVPYDYILIDCPPSIGLLCINALRACEEVIIPIDMSLFSLRGVAKLIEIILLLKEKLGHEIKPRALITMYDFRVRYAKRVLEKVKEKFGSNVFEAVIRYNIRLRETVDQGLPIGDYDKHSIGYKDFDNLTDEIMASGTINQQRQQDAVDMAKEILLNAEEYIETAAEASLEDEPNEFEEELDEIEDELDETEIKPTNNYSSPFRSLYSEGLEFGSVSSSYSPQRDDEHN